MRDIIWRNWSWWKCLWMTRKMPPDLKRSMRLTAKLFLFSWNRPYASFFDRFWVSVRPRRSRWKIYTAKYDLSPEQKDDLVVRMRAAWKKMEAGELQPPNPEDE